MRREEEDAALGSGQGAVTDDIDDRKLGLFHDVVRNYWQFHIDVMMVLEIIGNFTMISR